MSGLLDIFDPAQVHEMDLKEVEKIIAENEESKAQRQDLLRKKEEIVEAEKLCSKIKTKAGLVGSVPVFAWTGWAEENVNE